MADFRITVEIDPTGARRGGRQVRGELDRINRTADRSRQLLARFFGFAAIAAGLTGTIRLLARFEQEMSTVRAITGATEGQFAALREEAKRLGSSTRFSATQAAEGMTFLSRAGFDVNEVLQATEQTLTLAQAGALDLASAADIASNVLQGFNIRASESQRVVDVLALASNSANTNVSQLGQAMSFVAPASASLNVSLEQTAAAVGALSDAGIQATRAGTGLRQIFIQLQDSGDALLNISQRGLVPVLETLRDRQIGLSEAADLVGARQASALLVLTRSIPKIAELTEKFEDAEGAAAEIARIMDDNLNGALLAARSALEGLILELGDSGATGAFEGFFRAVAAGLRGLTANIQTFINVLETLALVLVAQLAKRAVPAVIAGINALTAAIAANPIGFLITAVTTAISLLIAFSDQLVLSSESGVTLQDVFVATAAEIGNAFRALGDLVLPIVDAIVSAAEEIVGPIEVSFQGVLQGAASVADGIIGVYVGAFSAIVATFDKLPGALGDLFFQAMDAVVEIVQDAINALIGGVNTVTEFIGAGSIGGVSLGVENPLAGRARDAGQTAGEAFAEGFAGVDVVSGAVDRIIQGAEARARKRAEDQAIRDALGDLPPSAPEPAAEPAGGGGAGGATQDALDRQAILENELRLLDQEAEALRLVGDEREVLRAKLSLEDEIRRELKSANENLSEAELNRLSKLTDAEAAAVEGAVRRNLELEREAKLLDDILGPQQQYEQNLTALNSLLEDGRISQDQYNDKVRELKLALLDTATDAASGFERGLLRIQEEFTDTATLAEDALVGAFTKAEDALVDYFTTGKLGFSDLVDSIRADLTRLAVRQAITAPLADLLGGASSGGGLLDDLFGGGGGGGLGSLFSGIGGLFGFADGGQFEVGGVGGRDRNVLSVNGQPVARVSKGETVAVSPEGGSGRPIQVNMNISTPDANSFRHSQDQLMARAAGALRRADQRNN